MIAFLYLRERDFSVILYEGETAGNRLGFLAHLLKSEELGWA
jgi:hypothetical protein